MYNPSHIKRLLATNLETMAEAAGGHSAGLLHPRLLWPSGDLLARPLPCAQQVAWALPALAAAGRMACARRTGSQHAAHLPAFAALQARRASTGST